MKNAAMATLNDIDRREYLELMKMVRVVKVDIQPAARECRQSGHKLMFAGDTQL